MKWIGNNLRIPFSISGTDCIEKVFADDNQISRRFKVLKLKEWRNGKEFQYFVYSYLKSLPGFQEVDALPSDLFETLLSSGSRTTFDIVTALGDVAYQAHINSDYSNLHSYAQKLIMKSGRVR